jgi:hypothetical protein
MNNVKIQDIKSNQQSKYEEIIEYLNQDDGYWLENDKWDMTESLFMGHKPRNKERFIDFSRISNNKLKNEVKY